MIKEIKLGRANISNLASSWKTVYYQIDYHISYEMEPNPFASARMIAKGLRIAVSNVIDHLHISLRMKNVSFRLIRHGLNKSQKDIGVILSKQISELLQKVKKKKNNNYEFMLTGYKSWFE